MLRILQAGNVGSDSLPPHVPQYLVFAIGAVRLHVQLGFHALQHLKYALQYLVVIRLGDVSLGITGV